MSAMQGYSMSLDYTHMYDVPDLRFNMGKHKESTIQEFAENTIAGIVYNDPKFSYFFRILRLSGLIDKFSGCGRKTLFAVPNDKMENTSCGILTDVESYLISMDKSTAKTIILNHSLDISMSENDVKGKTFYYKNMNGRNVLICDKYYDSSYIMGYKSMVNGSIFIIDKLICNSNLD